MNFEMGKELSSSHREKRAAESLEREAALSMSNVGGADFALRLVSEQTSR
ncbi:MAG: hypothetical protein LBB43_07675 [Spirochaetaceae bacterium]|jgi:hypothetical protein|nr:hypothetical protein [Spirochaetaceae bacterium]